jgi:hypothetical protein
MTPAAGGSTMIGGCVGVAAGVGTAAAALGSGELSGTTLGVSVASVPGKAGVPAGAGGLAGGAV